MCYALSYLSGCTDLSWIGRQIHGIWIFARVQIAHVRCDLKQFMISEEDDGQIFFCDAQKFGWPVSEPFVCRPEIQLLDIHPKDQMRLITRLIHPVDWTGDFVIVALWATLHELAFAGDKVEQFDSGRSEFMLRCNGNMRDFLVICTVSCRFMLYC